MQSPENTEPTDGDLVARARAGDEAAFRVLHDRYRAHVLARVRRRLPQALRRRVTESDVVQEAFTAAFEGLAGLRAGDDGAFLAWLGKIADRKVTEAARRHLHADIRAADKETSRDRRQETGAFAAPGMSPSEHAVDRERREALAEAVARLPEDYRTILRLIHEEGLTLLEAGERMGRSAEAARKLYGRAAGSLSDAMSGGEGA